MTSLMPTRPAYQCRLRNRQDGVGAQRRDAVLPKGL
jgi:hypothetical protein